jgi:hypothetical protein
VTLTVVQKAIVILKIVPKAPHESTLEKKLTNESEG